MGRELNMILLNFNKESITKKNILNKVSEKDIYIYYLGDKWLTKKTILSPLRKEKNPSFGIYLSNSGLKWKDFGGTSGDVFSLIQYMYNLSFSEALKKIYNDLILNLSTINLRSLQTKTFQRQLKPSQIFIKPKIFTFRDIKYWDSFGISLKTLIKYKVKSVKEVWIDDYFFAKSTLNYLIFAYLFKEGIKLYSPFASIENKWRFEGNKDIISGYEQLSKNNDILILTKSLKDVMLLDELGYNAISLQSENIYLRQSIVTKLLEQYKEIIIFYDNDKTGKSSSKQIVGKYSFKEIFIPNQYSEKDISDFYKTYGKEKTKQILKKILYERNNN